MGVSTLSSTIRSCILGCALHRCVVTCIIKVATLLVVAVKDLLA